MTIELDERQLRLALEYVPVPMLAHDETGRIRYLNEEWLRVTGYRPEQIPTFAAWLELALKSPDDIATVMASHRAGYGAPPGPLHRDWEFSIRAADGSKRRWNIRAFSIGRDAAGRAVNVTIAVDMTRERATLEALAQSESRLRFTLEAGRVGAFDWDMPSGELIWDERVREIWGVASDQPLTIADFYRGLHRGDVARLEKIIAASHDPEGDGGYDAEYRVVNARDGDVRHVAARGRTLFENGRATRMMGVVVEVTALREAQTVLERDRAELERLVEARTRELAEAQTRLAHAQRMEALGQLAGGIAHDFNNVLQAVEAAADLIERTLRRAEPAALSAHGARGDQARQRDLAPPVVVLAPRRTGAGTRRRRLSHRRSRRHPAPHARGRGHGADGCRNRLPRHSRRPAATGDRSAQPRGQRARGDGRCRRADADRPPRHRRRGGGFAVSRQPAAGRIRPHRDRRHRARHGCGGVARARPSRSFRPSRAARAPGSACRWRAASPSSPAARLRIDSEPGQGAAIALWLPLAPPDAADAPEGSKANGGKLLLVDDDPLVRELIGEQLRGAGFDVTVCDKGPAAIARLDAGLAVDLLLTDFAMPEMNGVALAREARKRRPRLPVVVLTGYASEAVDAAGDADFALLRKPIDRQALIGRVTALMTPR